MSVILDALSKARTDRRKIQGGPHPNSVARVLEPVVTPPEQTRMPHKTGSRWVVPVVLMLGVLCLMVLAAGAFFLLYDQMRRFDPAATAQPAPAAQAAIGLPEVPMAALATPLPLSELPVHTPAPVVSVPDAAAALSSPAPPPTAAAVAPAASNAGFKLGSIVCETNDCIANLNGRSVRLGDTVRNYQVIEITPSAITLQGATAADVITLSHYD